MMEVAGYQIEKSGGIAGGRLLLTRLFIQLLRRDINNMIYRFSRAKQLSVRLLVIIITMTLILPVGLLSPMSARAEGATVTWTGNAGDKSWHTAGNWDGDQVPSTGDTVIIPAESVVEYVYGAVYGETTVTLECAGQLTVSGGNTFNITGPSIFTEGKLINHGTVNINTNSAMNINVLENEGDATINSDLTLKDLQLKSGTVKGSGNLTIDDSLNAFGWTGGTLEGAGTLTVGPQGSFPISGNIKNLNRKLINKGYIYFGSTATISDTIDFINSGKIEVCHSINPELRIPNYTQTETGVLTLDMRDATSNPNWAARLDTKNASLAGTLNLKFVSYNPDINTPLRS